MISIRSTAPLIGAIAVLLAAFRIWVPSFLAMDNLMNLVQQISINAILAFGLTLVILIGGIDLSVGAVVALVGTMSVYVLSATESTTLAILAGFGVTLAFGLFHGMLAAWSLMPPFIITLGTMLIARGFAFRFNEGRPMRIGDRHDTFLALGNGRVMSEWLPVPVILMLVVLAIAFLLLHRTRFGQHLYAIGGNREAAVYTGIRISQHEIAAYLFCSLCAGLGGLIHCSQLYSAEPGSGTHFELNAIAAVVVGGTSFTGGRGTMIGTLLGAIVIGILDKGLNQAGVHFSTQYIVKGAVILLAVYLDVWRRKSDR